MPIRNALMDDEPWKSRGLRRCFVINYTIFYLVDDANFTVRIIRIKYNGKDVHYQLSESNLP